MHVKIIKQNEQSNNCSTIHLYYNNEMHSWIAYGHSAYALRLLVKSHHIDSIRGFSTTMQMPYTAINKGALKLLCDSLEISQGDSAAHLIVKASKEFDPND